MEGEGADEAAVLALPFPKIFGIVDGGAVVKVDDGSCGGFANEN